MGDSFETIAGGFSMAPCFSCGFQDHLTTWTTQAPRDHYESQVLLAWKQHETLFKSSKLQVCLNVLNCNKQVTIKVLKKNLSLWHLQSFFPWYFKVTSLRVRSGVFQEMDAAVAYLQNFQAWLDGQVRWTGWRHLGHRYVCWYKHQDK